MVVFKNSNGKCQKHYVRNIKKIFAKDIVWFLGAPCLGNARQLVDIKNAMRPNIKRQKNCGLKLFPIHPVQITSRGLANKTSQILEQRQS